MPNSKPSSKFSNHCWKHKCFTAAIHTAALRYTTTHHLQFSTPAFVSIVATWLAMTVIQSNMDRYSDRPLMVVILTWESQQWIPRVNIKTCCPPSKGDDRIKYHNYTQGIPRNVYSCFTVFWYIFYCKCVCVGKCVKRWVVDVW